MTQAPKKKTAAAARKRSAKKSVAAKTRGTRLAQLREKYGARAIDGLARVHPHHIAEHVDWCDALDPHFTRLWLDFTYGGMSGRGILDERTRCLVLVGQFLVMEEPEQFAIQIHNALRHASPREVLEVIPQSTIYVGMPRFVRVVSLLQRILEEDGRLGELTQTQLPLPL